MTTKGEKERLLRLLNLEETETKRVAKELHHDLAQFLGMVKLDLERGIRQIEDNQVKIGIKSLDTALPKIQQAIDQIQKIGFHLWPPTLENAHLGILPTISWFCRQFQETHPNICIDVQVDIHEDEIHDSLKPTVYKFLREALHSTEYSKATLVRVFLLRRELTVELTVQDDGQRFDMDKKDFTDSKLMLNPDSMKERTEMTGGSFSIESVKGKGTIIRASWPI